MRETTLPLLLACTLTSLAANAANPSFDCANATQEVEKAICKDAELAELDRILAELYRVALQETPASEKVELRTEQSAWIKGRNDCRRSSDQRGCVKGEYEVRIRELSGR